MILQFLHYGVTYYPGLHITPSLPEVILLIPLSFPRKTQSMSMSMSSQSGSKPPLFDRIESNFLPKCIFRSFFTFIYIYIYTLSWWCLDSLFWGEVFISIGSWYTDTPWATLTPPATLTPANQKRKEGRMLNFHFLYQLTSPSHPTRLNSKILRYNELIKHISTLQKWSDSIHYWWWLHCLKLRCVEMCWSENLDVLNPEWLQNWRKLNFRVRNIKISISTDLNFRRCNHHQ